MESVIACNWGTHAENGYRYVEFSSICPYCRMQNDETAALLGEDSDPQAFYSITCSHCDKDYDVQV